MVVTGPRWHVESRLHCKYTGIFRDLALSSVLHAASKLLSRRFLPHVSTESLQAPLAIAIESSHGFIEPSTDSGMARRERARAVFEYLVSSGVRASRLAIEQLPSGTSGISEPRTIEEAEAAQRISVRVTNY